MSKYYSKSTGGFYPAEMRSDYECEATWPFDAVEISEETYDQVSRFRPADKIVIADSNGFPVLADLPTPAHSDLVAQALTETREQRQPIIGILDGMQSSALTNGDTITAKAIEAAKQSLKDITKTDLSACLTYEDMRQAMKAAYAAIVMAAPASVITAFASVVK